MPRKKEPKQYLPDSTPCKLKHEERCTAKSKQSGERCRRRRAIGFAVCDKHGGHEKSGAPVKHGGYSKLVKNARLRELIEQAAQVKDQHDNSERLEVLDGLLRSKLERLGVQGSAELWKETRQTFAELKAAIRAGDKKKLPDLLSELDSLLNNGLAEHKAEQETLSLIQQMASVSKVQIGLEYARATAMSEREARVFLAAVTHAIRTFVKCPEEKKQIFGFLDREIGLGGSANLS
jgi:hypothetical protein